MWSQFGWPNNVGSDKANRKFDRGRKALRITVARSVIIVLSEALLLGFGVAFGWAQSPDPGYLAGTVFDAASGRPIPGAKVEVVGGTGASATTDAEGQYVLELPAGTYSLRVTAPGYLPGELTELTVSSGEVTDGSTLLTFAEASTRVEVVERLDTITTTARLVEQRQFAAAVTDGISGEEMSRLNASDVADALRRLTGIQVNQQGHVFVRGLGERYSLTRVDGASTPSPEPERRVVPLSLFGTELIDQVQVIKAYTPDLPGEFSGGSVEVHTRNFPTQPFLRAGFKQAFNTRTTFRPFWTYPGGAWDAFGFDDGTRRIPSLVPSDRRLFRNLFTPEQLQEFGRAFSVNWQPTLLKRARPGQDYSLVGGGTFGALGLSGALAFGNDLQSRQQVFRLYTNQGDGRGTPWTQYDDFEVGREHAQLGAALHASYRISAAQRVSVRNLLVHDADKEARIFTGYNGGTDALMRSERLDWVERQIRSTTFTGEHSTRVWNSLLRWRFQWATSHRDQPDLREVLWIQRGQRFQLFNSPDSAVRFFGYLSEDLHEPALDWSVPFYRSSLAGQLRLGGQLTLRKRDFWSRRFRFVPITARNLDLTLPANKLLAPANIHPTGFELREITRATDAYGAELHMASAYAMADVNLGGRWRLVAGVRVEDADQKVITEDPYNPLAVPVVARLRNRDALPAISLVWNLTKKQNFRLAYSRTVSRPDFRELSPFDFTDVVGGWATVGNPKLKRAAIRNVDASWEWFPGGDQVVAVSGFWKEFVDPIELMFEPGITLRRTYANARWARNRGFEVELRRRFQSLPHYMGQLAVVTNFAVIDSRVRVPDEQRYTVTNLVRPLMGQSRYVFNSVVDWSRPDWRSSCRVLLNAVSRRLAAIGTFGLEDIYQEPDVFLDLVYDLTLSETGSWTLRFVGENLTDHQFRWTQGGLLHQQFRLGRTFKLGFSFSVF